MFLRGQTLAYLHSPHLKLGAPLGAQASAPGSAGFGARERRLATPGAPALSLGARACDPGSAGIVPGSAGLRPRERRHCPLSAGFQPALWAQPRMIYAAGPPLLRGSQSVESFGGVDITRERRHLAGIAGACNAPLPNHIPIAKNSANVTKDIQLARASATIKRPFNVSILFIISGGWYEANNQLITNWLLKTGILGIQQLSLLRKL
jgi:hypothetical protein